MTANFSTSPHCPSCGSPKLKLNDAANHAQCEACLFFCHVAPDGTTTDDRDTPVDAGKLTFDDLNEHPAFLQVFARRFAEFAGMKVSDEVTETVANHFIESKLPKPSGSTLS